MGSLLVNPASLPITQVQNQFVPDEGPKAIAMLLDFTSAQEYDVDLLQIQQEGRFSMCQTIFIDASQLVTTGFTVGGILVEVGSGNFQNIFCPFGRQGYFPLLCPNPVKLKILNIVTNLPSPPGTFTPGLAPAGTVPVTVILLNVPIAGSVW